MMRRLGSGLLPLAVRQHGSNWLSKRRRLKRGGGLPRQSGKVSGLQRVPASARGEFLHAKSDGQDDGYSTASLAKLVRTSFR